MFVQGPFLFAYLSKVTGTCQKLGNVPVHDLLTNYELLLPSATLNDKMQMGKRLLNRQWFDKNSLDYTDIVSDIFDAVYFHRTFIKEEDAHDEELVKLFKAVTIPTTRLFNAYLRIQAINTQYALGIQNEMNKLNLKPSPATLVAMYRHLDENHIRLMREQISRNGEELFLTLTGSINS